LHRKPYRNMQLQTLHIPKITARNATCWLALPLWGGMGEAPFII